MSTPGRIVAVVAGAEILLAAVLAAVLCARPGDAGPDRPVNREVVSTLLLTDLALWPGASYSRHPSQADRFAPFSDHPAALEHSPAGSLLPVPPPAAPRSWRLPPGVP